MSQDHKLKEGDEVFWTAEATNKNEIIFFTNMQQAYKAHLYDFEDSKASVLGDYLASKLEMDEAKRRFMPSCRVTTRAVWSLCSKTARQPGFRWNPSRPRPTDAA